MRNYEMQNQNQEWDMPAEKRSSACGEVGSARPAARSTRRRIGVGEEARANADARTGVDAMSKPCAKQSLHVLRYAI